ELMAFISLGRTLDHDGGSRPALHNLVRAAMQLTGATTAAIISEPPTGHPVCLLAEGAEAQLLQPLRQPSPEPLLRRVLEAHKPLIVPELRADPELATGLLALLGFSSALALPLLSAPGVVGTLILLDPPHPFSERQSSLVKVIAAQAAEVIALAQLREPTAVPDHADDFIDLRDALGAN
ncbi:MAG: GAF domain-containing protein, partial [Armatimonadota bacterium]